jgi:hypothetical protein
MRSAIRITIAAAMMMLVGKVRLAPYICVPSPPALIKTASVAIAIVLTEAIRNPPMISGIASGISTRQRIWRLVKPIPRAASLTEAGTLVKPSIVLR